VPQCVGVPSSPQPRATDLASIIVRNSILSVDFINQQVRGGMAFEQAVIDSAVVRAKPIALTAVAAMAGALFILDDPIFSGLAVSLLFGLFVSSLLTLVVIPIVYYGVMRNRVEWIRTATAFAGAPASSRHPKARRSISPGEPSTGLPRWLRE